MQNYGSWPRDEPAPLIYTCDDLYQNNLFGFQAFWFQVTLRALAKQSNILHPGGKACDFLATFLNIAFKWLPMFDLDHIFIQHFASQATVWSFSHLRKQNTPKWQKAANQEPNLCDITAHCKYFSAWF